MKALSGQARKKIDLDAAGKVQLEEFRISLNDPVVVQSRERLYPRHHISTKR